jgi:hypothetical protein
MGMIFPEVVARVIVEELITDLVTSFLAVLVTLLWVLESAGTVVSPAVNPIGARVGAVCHTVAAAFARRAAGTIVHASCAIVDAVRAVVRAAGGPVHAIADASYLPALEERRSSTASCSGSACSYRLACARAA